jgi:hypothetical protein
MGNLFQSGQFKLNSGKVSNFKIECDALTQEDIDTFALLISQKYKFKEVVGVPTGGIRIEDALKKGYKLKLSSLEIKEILDRESDDLQHFILYETPTGNLVIGVFESGSSKLYGMRYNGDGNNLGPVVLTYLHTDLSKEHSFQEENGNMTSGVIYHYEMIFGNDYDNDPKGKYNFDESNYGSGGGRRTRKTKKTKGSKRSKSTRGRR